jgi:hypothetical protein
VTYDLRARPLVLVLLFIVAAAAAGLLVLQRMGGSSNAGSTSATHAASGKHRSLAKPVARHAASPRPKAKAPTPTDRLPAAIRRALAADHVVVVSLYDPKGAIDGTAMREAQAGAQRAGSSFVAIDVRKNGVASLNAQYGVIQDPAVLVLRPPGSLVVRIDGFADRDTVAQAAVNAASS